jgi:hypothetical protein
MALAVAGLAALAIGRPAAAYGEDPVLIAGHDLDGTLVVGAVDCEDDERWAARTITARPSGTYTEVWAIERPGGGGAPPTEAPIDPPDPRPAFVAGIEMVSVGDQDPDRADLTVAPGRPLPEGQLVISAALLPLDAPFASITTTARGGRDSYTVVVDGRTYEDLDATGAADVIIDRCHVALPDGGTMLLTGLVAAGGVAAVVAGLMVLATRQGRRAQAANARRRAGLPPRADP